jgi:hypothetical protein
MMTSTPAPRCNNNAEGLDGVCAKTGLAIRQKTKAMMTLFMGGGEMDVQYM